LKKAGVYEVRHDAGRLILTRLLSLRSTQDLQEALASVGRLVAKIGDPVVVCTDWRPIDVFPPEIADMMLTALQKGNNAILRSAILQAPTAAVFQLQVERVLRAAQNPSRRAFRDPALMLAWLGEVLDAEELQSAAAFLNSPGG
jgi:hypothetical protein